MTTSADRRNVVFFALVLVLLVCLGVAIATVTGAHAERQERQETTTVATDTSEYQLVNAGKLTVAAAMADPPFLYQSYEYQVGTVTEGFTKDLFDKIGERLGLQVEYVEAADGDSLTGPLTSGTADIVATPTVISSSYTGYAHFSDSYMDLDQCVAIMKSSGITSVDELAGKSIGVVKGSVAETWALANIPDARIVEYDDLIYVQSALRSGNLDGIVGDYVHVNYNCRVKYGNERIISVSEGSEQYGFLVGYGKTNLLKAINAALSDIKASGEYDELYDEWFGGDNEPVWVESRDLTVYMGDVR